VHDVEPIARRIARGLARVSVAIRSRAWREGVSRGLTPTQGQVLALLRFQPDRAATLSAIADGLAVTPATASEAVRVLEAKGLVAKEPGLADRRARVVALTPRGAEEADRVVQWPDFLAAAVESLDPDEQHVLLRSLVKMIKALQDRGEIPVARMCVTCQYFRPNVHPGRSRPHHCAYVDAPIGDADLRLDCPDHQAADPERADGIWRAFVGSSNRRDAT